MILKKTKDLAELIGIILGDGNLGIYPQYKNGVNTGKARCQYLRIYCNLNEKQYAGELEKILTQVFNKKPYCYERSRASELYLEISQKNLDKSLGIKTGDKIKNKVTIPQWIFKNKECLTACLRGIFDTDGCCYKTGAKYLIINFTNHNFNLLSGINFALEKLGFHPYLKKSKRDVELGRQLEIRKFFSIIAPRNRKHYRFLAG
jgi:intein/homing endonuclease